MRLFSFVFCRFVKILLRVNFQAFTFALVYDVYVINILLINIYINIKKISF